MSNLPAEQRKDLKDGAIAILSTSALLLTLIVAFVVKGQVEPDLGMAARLLFLATVLSSLSLYFICIRFSFSTLEGQRWMVGVSILVFLAGLLFLVRAIVFYTH